MWRMGDVENDYALIFYRSKANKANLDGALHTCEVTGLNTLGRLDKDVGIVF